MPVLRLLLACLCASLAVPALAHAQAEGSATIGPPIVLVVDGAGSRLSITRLTRTLETVLARPILRPADDGAADAAATLTIAFSSPRRWLVRFDEAGLHPTRTMDVRGPALEVLVGLAVQVVTEANAAPSAHPGEPGALVTSEAAFATPPGGEIIDPFVGLQASRLSIAVVGELLDPFAHLGGGVRVIATPEVLDPWR